MPEKEHLHYGTASLKARGWTDALITKFLPVPDLLAPNPHYRSAAPWKLYLISRVEAIEQSDAWQLAALRARPRRRAAAQAVVTKRAAMERHVQRLEYQVPILEREALIRDACRNFNQRQGEWRERHGRYDEDGQQRRRATADSPPWFLARICVNFLRHQMTPYEEHLDAVAGRVGVAVAYGVIVAKVLDAIAAAYPWLSDECARQKAARVGVEAKPDA